MGLIMLFLVLVLSLAGLSLAHPDVSHLNGYSYSQPSNGISINSGIGSTNIPSGSYLPGQSGANILDPRFLGFGGGISGSNGYSNSGFPNSFSSGNGFISGNGISGSIGFNPQSELVQDQKHVYFFAAPDDEEQTRLRINVASAGQKNTKIIFIKAPGYSSPIPEVIAPPSQAEDKTLVYVLVKKPEHLQPITIPASASVKQAKPEVYFIKYRTKEEAEQAVTGGLSEQAVGSGVQSLSDEQSFIRTLKDDSHQNDGFVGEGIAGSSILTSGGSLNGGASTISARASLSSSSGESSINASINGGNDAGSKYGPPTQSGPYK